MTDQVVVKAPDCKERVAFELALRIHHDEMKTPHDKKDRSAWLKLYRECHEVVVFGQDPSQK